MRCLGTARASAAAREIASAKKERDREAYEPAAVGGSSSRASGSQRHSTYDPTPLHTPRESISSVAGVSNLF